MRFNYTAIVFMCCTKVTKKDQLAFSLRVPLVSPLKCLFGSFRTSSHLKCFLFLFVLSVHKLLTRVDLSIGYRRKQQEWQSTWWWRITICCSVEYMYSSVVIAMCEYGCAFLYICIHKFIYLFIYSSYGHLCVCAIDMTAFLGHSTLWVGTLFAFLTIVY